MNSLNFSPRLNPLHPILLRLLALALLLSGSHATADTYFTTTNTLWRHFKGYSEPSSPNTAAWREPEFDDGQWSSAPAPFYYTDTTFEPPFYVGGPVIGTVLNDMINNYTCLYLRKTFLVTNAANSGPVTIQIAGDDAFIVWLNGVEVRRTNVVNGFIPYNGTAIVSMFEPYPIHSFVLTNGAAWLREGTNVLAVQAINSVSNSHDFGFMAGLSAELDNSPPLVASVEPPPGLTLASLAQVRLTFNEAVTNVEAADLLINGQPASSLTIHSLLDYSFGFSQPNTGLVTVAWAPAHNIRDASGNLFGGSNWNYVLNTNAVSTAIISEFMADNTGPLLDEDGESSDWIEIHNPGPLAVNLLDWCLTDDSTELTKWRFPATNLPPNTYLVVFASNKNRRIPGARLHTNFRLDQDGGYLALVHSNGTSIVSEFAPTYPPQRENISYGFASGGGQRFFTTPTPGTNNGAGIQGFVADTTFSVDRGFFYAPTNVTVSSATIGATVVYTLNGTEPSLANGTQVNAVDAFTPPIATIAITNTTLLRAAAFKTGYLPTDVDTHTYIFPTRITTQTRPGWIPSSWPSGHPADFDIDSRVVNTALPGFSVTNALLSLPTISIVMPSNDLFSAGSGIYANSTSSGPSWEKRAAAELIFPDGRPGFHINCGIRIRGNSSADKNMTPKHSFSLVFREEFGPTKLEFPLFTNSPVQRFDILALRGCSTDSWLVFEDPFYNPPRWSQPEASYVRDQWMRDAALDMGSPSSHGIYVHLYLDGLYWGVYNLSERPDDSFAASYLGGEKSEYDSVADGGELNGGNLNAWNSLMQAASSGFVSDTAYQRVQGNNADGTRNTNYPVLIHLTNLVDIMILHIYAGAVDWAHHNWWAARRQGPESEGFRFFVWDQEISNNSLIRTRVDSVNNGNPIFTDVSAPNSPAYVYAAMRQNAEFRRFFGDRVHKHLFNNGVLTTNANIARWNARTAEIDRAMVGESARWGDHRRPPLAYKRETEWASNNNWVVNTYFPSNHFIALKRFRDANLYPALGAPTFSQFGGSVPAGYALTITHANGAGTLYYTLDGSDPRAVGGALAGSALPYTSPVSLVSPTLVRARVRNGADWSALVEARFTTPQDFSSLLITELHYNPPTFMNADGEEFEFLELHNRATNTLDLGGLSFSGINFTFTNETLLGPGAFLVLVRNPSLFNARFPGAPWHGVFSGKLDNAGETIALRSGAATVLSVTFDDVLPWPLQADGSGLSLQRVNAAPNANAPNNWTAAVPTPGNALPAALVDSDGDGMTDVWEDTYGFNYQSADDANEDADNDSITNLAEFRAGTDPRNPSDYLKLDSIAFDLSTGPAVVLRFHAVENRSYSILRRVLAHEGCWETIANIESQPTSRSVSFTNAIPPGTETSFYRIVTPSRPMGCAP